MNNNDSFQGPFEKTTSNDEKSNGFGLETPTAYAGWNGEGSQSSERAKRLEREIGRFNELNSKVLGKPVAITNEGIVLDSFGGMFGEGGSKPDVQGGANK